MPGAKTRGRRSPRTAKPATKVVVVKPANLPVRRYPDIKYEHLEYLVWRTQVAVNYGTEGFFADMPDAWEDAYAAINGNWGDGQFAAEHQYFAALSPEGQRRYIAYANIYRKPPWHVSNTEIMP